MSWCAYGVMGFALVAILVPPLNRVAEIPGSSQKRVPPVEAPLYSMNGSSAW